MAWSNPGDISVRLEVNWSKNLSTWVDETSNLISANGEQSMLMIWQQFGSNTDQPPWTATFVLDEADGRYDPLNDGSGDAPISPLYSDISDNLGYSIPIRFDVGEGSPVNWQRKFTGYIDTINPDTLKGGTVTINCSDNSQPLLQERISLATQLNLRTDAWINHVVSQSNVSFTTDVDSGLQVTPFNWMDSDQAWSEIQEAAHSEGGRAAFATDGTLQFRNLESWLIDTVYTISQHTFDETNVDDMSTFVNWDDVFNRVVVTAETRRRIGAFLEVFRLDEIIMIPAGQAVTITAAHSALVVTIATPVNGTDFVATSGDTDITSSVALTLTAYGQRSEITLTNNHATSPAQITRLILRGEVLPGGPDIEAEREATDSGIGNPASVAGKTLAINRNMSIQTKTQVNFLADVLMALVKVPRPIYRLPQSPPNPVLEPGYRVTVDNMRHGARDGYITNITWRVTNGQYFEDYEVLDADNWLPYDNYFRIGTDTFSSSRRMFY